MRLFIAAQFNNIILNELIKLQDYWKSLGMKGHFAPLENLHLTLAFIGEYKDPDYVAQTLETVTFSPFSIQLDGIGNFNDLYYAGIVKNNEMSNSVKRIRRALADNNIPYDRKRFAPHITLIRSAVYDGKTENLTKNPPKGEMIIDTFSLMSSTRGKNSMIYKTIASYPHDFMN